MATKEESLECGTATKAGDIRRTGSPNADGERGDNDAKISVTEACVKTDEDTDTAADSTNNQASSESADVQKNHSRPTDRRTARDTAKLTEEDTQELAMITDYRASDADKQLHDNQRIETGTDEKTASDTAEQTTRHTENATSKSSEVNVGVTAGNDDIDPELDDLLESALEDFGRPLPSTNVRQCVESSTDTGDHVEASNLPTSCHAQIPLSSQRSHDTLHQSAPAPRLTSIPSGQLGASSDNQSQEAMFNEVFSRLADQPPQDLKAMESLIMSLMTGGARGAEPTLDLGADMSEPGGGGDLADTLQQTLGSLASNAQGLQDDDISDEELMRMMSSLGGLAGGAGGGLGGLLGGEEGGGGEEGSEFMPMMQGMMKNLLSRDVLYPSLKEISAQYPAWLAANKGVVSDAEHARYTRQHALMSAIVGEFEGERADDSEEMKRTRFERILDVMQRMQELGHPPKEIVGEIPAGLDVDENGIPKMFGGMATNPEQCVVM